MRWFRKNNTKLMAVVVVLIMFGFIGGSYFSRMANKSQGHANEVIATTGKTKITRNEFIRANNELEILRLLGFGKQWQVQSISVAPRQNLHTIFLTKILFGKESNSNDFRLMKELINANNYQISDQQIDDICQVTQSNALWMMLTAEVEKSGGQISTVKIKEAMAGFIPTMMQGATYSQVIGFVMNKTKASENEILNVCGKLFAILNYAKSICMTEEVTLNQLAKEIGLAEQAINTEFINIQSSDFIDSDKGSFKAAAAQISEQFAKYKDNFAGDSSNDNPCGFGYKLDDMANVEYLAVDQKAVAKTIKRPTSEQTERFYQNNLAAFVENIPSDPQDPNSISIQRTRKYAKVAQAIKQQMIKQRTQAKISKIFKAAAMLSQDETTETEQLEKLHADYGVIASKLTKEFGVKIYTGKTGLMTAFDMQNSPDFGWTVLVNTGTNSQINMVQLIFAVEQLGSSRLSTQEAAMPKMYEDIGPMKNMITGNVLLARVVDTQKAVAPKTIDIVTASTVDLFKQNEQDSNRTVEQTVIRDLEKIDAMKKAKQAAQYYMEIAAGKTIEESLDKLNQKYGTSEDPNRFKITKSPKQKKVPQSLIAKVVAQSEGNPMQKQIIANILQQQILVDKFYALANADGQTANVPAVIEFASQMSYLCVHSLEFQNIYQEQQDVLRKTYAMQFDVNKSYELAADFFNPANIEKRMDFTFVSSADKKESSEPNSVN